VISGITSAKVKLVRAEKHLRAIKRCIAAYAASEPYKIVPKAKGKKKLNIPKSPPRQLTLLTGEMLYQMRSALDHLAFALVESNPNVTAIDPDWRDHCQFPLRTRLPKNCSPPLAKRKFASDLPGIADVPFAFVERLQPYYRLGTINNALGFLADLSNIDKHRYLNLIRPRVRKREVVRFASGMRGSGHMALDRGAEILPPWSGHHDRTVYVNRRYRTFVTFKESDHLGDAITLPMDLLLQTILEQIQTVIVPAFEKFIKKG
jgi:hypothetical protein